MRLWKKAKEMMDNCSFETTKVVCQELFPELVASEDERIRKWLLECVENLSDGNFIEVSRQDVLAYLEKQKPMYNLEIPAGDVAPAEEDSPFDEDEFLEGELSAFLQNYDKEYDDDAAVSDVARHFYEIGKKQKEEEGYEAIPVESTLEYKLGFKAGKESEKQKEPENTSASVMAPSCWEVEQKATEVKDPFSNANFVRGYESGYADAKREQKPAEGKEYSSPECSTTAGVWSEEDEKILDSLIRLYSIEYSEYVCPWANGTITYGDVVNFLKSLHPQYHGDVTMTEAYKMGKEAGEASHWKPSEEQMDALERTIHLSNFGLEEDRRKALVSLYEQLKKLM